MSKDARVAGPRALIVGLGNPGSRYEGTRHNAGARVVAALATRWRMPAFSSQFRGRVATGQLGGRPVALLIPETFMNLSGESVQPAAAFWKCPVDGIVVVHDDLDIALGRVRVKQGGGHAGHNGLRSCDQHLAAPDYFRVRVGVGRPLIGDVSSWVLGRFPDTERDSAERAFELAADAVEILLRDGLLAAQSRIHAA